MFVPPLLAQSRTSSNESVSLAPNSAPPPVLAPQSLQEVARQLYLNSLTEINNLVNNPFVRNPCMLSKMGQLTAEPSTATTTPSGGVSQPLEEPPLFLRKTFQMIDQCPQNLGGWSAAGDTFLVYDAETFARAWIPRFFRHNKFSSFVRQLNFYGFRKVKSDEHGLRRDVNANGQRMWEFRHELFKKGHPELMRLINRRRDREGQSTTSNQEVVHLKNELSTMNKKLSSVTDRCEELEKQVKSLTDFVKNIAEQLQSGKQIQTGQRPGESHSQESEAGLQGQMAQDELPGNVPVALTMTLRKRNKRTADSVSVADGPPKRAKGEEGRVTPTPSLDREPLQRLPSWGEVAPFTAPTFGVLTSVDMSIFETMTQEPLARTTSDVIPDIDLSNQDLLRGIGEEGV